MCWLRGRTYRSTKGDEFKPGRPDDSELIQRISKREEGWSMPALGTEEVDAEGVALLRRWIKEMED